MTFKNKIRPLTSLLHYCSSENNWTEKKTESKMIFCKTYKSVKFIKRLKVNLYYRGRNIPG